MRINYLDNLLLCAVCKDSIRMKVHASLGLNSRLCHVLLSLLLALLGARGTTARLGRLLDLVARCVGAVASIAGAAAAASAGGSITTECIDQQPS